ncbi:MAG: phosphate ABC transporter substrate-binding protein [Magnetococcales bacterium]|nr:phosphate ABC transporter substrate-binding protein [Magnetococcales bacterium]NGZ07170.1 phosphate ABC transporter substrate-binding protein [Magnetococcales bacterium]
MKQHARFVAATLVVGLATGYTQEVSARTMIQNKGSDTLVNVAQAWAEAYQKVKPDVAVAVTGGGTGTGIAAMINGTVDMANASRTMKEKEIAEAKKNGVTPKEHVVGYDALAIFVHKSNPMTSISIKQLAEIYGDGGKFDNWSKLGVQVPGCQRNQIIVVNRQNNSGTYVYFQEAVLGEGKDFRLGTKDMHGSKDVIDLVEKTPCAIGYSGLAYDSPHVKKLPVTKDENAKPVEATMANAIAKIYPIARPLFMYTKGEPTGEVKTYLEWIVSDVGQCIIEEKGYAPIRPVKCAK